MAEPLSLTDVRCRYTVRRDPRDGRDFIIDSHGEWTTDPFAVGFYDCVVWHYRALAMAGPETTWQEFSTATPFVTFKRFWQSNNNLRHKSNHKSNRFWLQKIEQTGAGEGLAERKGDVTKV